MVQVVLCPLPFADREQAAARDRHDDRDQDASRRPSKPAPSPVQLLRGFEEAHCAPAAHARKWAREPAIMLQERAGRHTIGWTAGELPCLRGALEIGLSLEQPALSLDPSGDDRDLSEERLVHEIDTLKRRI